MQNCPGFTQYCQNYFYILNFDSLITCQMPSGEYSERSPGINNWNYQWSMFMGSLKLKIQNLISIRFGSEKSHKKWRPCGTQWLTRENMHSYIFSSLNDSLSFLFNDVNAADKNCAFRGCSWCRNAQGSTGCTRKMDVAGIIHPPQECGICKSSVIYVSRLDLELGEL